MPAAWGISGDYIRLCLSLSTDGIEKSAVLVDAADFSLGVEGGERKKL